MHIVILAGGGGTRLWPLSRQDFPKQFLHFGDQQSLLQKCIIRFLNSPLAESVSIVTNSQYELLVKQQLEKVDPASKTNIIIEPARKNTAPAIAFALKYLQETQQIEENASILVLPSDHLIEPQTLFAHYLEQIAPLLKDELFLFGIQPNKPETGYGYIQVGEKFNAFTHHVKRFVEKPDLALAEEYLASGDYYWNAGMFAFSLRHFWELLAIYSPDIDRFMQGSMEQVISHFDKIPEISFDYAILEKAKRILICPLPVSWSDVGCWDSVYDIMEKDQNQNVKFGNILDIETKNSLIIGGKRLISTVGLENLLIVETEDVTFISKMGESQKVKGIVQELLKIGKKEGASHPTERCAWGLIHPIDQGKKYRIQKVQIQPEQIAKIHFTHSGNLILVEGSLKLEDHSLNLFQPHPVKKGETLQFFNSSPQDTAEFLMILYEFSESENFSS